MLMNDQGRENFFIESYREEMNDQINLMTGAQVI